MAENRIKTCTECVDALWSCLGLGFQAREYYRNGDFDMCDDLKNELWLCLGSKFRGKSAEDLIGTALDRERPNVSPTIGVIWDERPPPTAAEAAAMAAAAPAPMES